VVFQLRIRIEPSQARVHFLRVAAGSDLLADLLDVALVEVLVADATDNFNQINSN
jgi:hypothetical protein